MQPCSERDSSDDDRTLLRRVRACDDDAFDELVRRHGGALLRVARRMLDSDADAQDAVQEAFLSAFRGLEGFDGQCRLATWLHRILLNVCLMRLRSRRRRPEQSIGALLPEFLDDGHQRVDSRPWRALPVAELECAELRRLVREKIDQLPTPYREVLLLRDIEELDTEQTAALLRTTTGALKTRLHRARQALRALLEPHFAEVSP